MILIKIKNACNKQYFNNLNAKGYRSIRRYGFRSKITADLIKILFTSLLKIIRSLADKFLIIYSSF